MIGLMVLRVVIGALFIGHGAQKLFGWFGGHGLEGTGHFFESIGLRPGRRNAALAGGGEVAGGTLLTLGLATPLGASLLTGSMVAAIWQVHRNKGPWLAEGGYEYNLVLLAAVFALSDAGPGALALDQQRRGTAWAVGELVAGAGGAIATLALAHPEPQLVDTHGDGAVHVQTPAAA